MPICVDARAVGGRARLGGRGRRVTPRVGAWPVCFTHLGRCHLLVSRLAPLLGTSGQVGWGGGGGVGSNHKSVPGPSAPHAAGIRRSPAPAVGLTCPTPWHKSAGTTQVLDSSLLRAIVAQRPMMGYARPYWEPYGSNR